MPRTTTTTEKTPSDIPLSDISNKSIATATSPPGMEECLARVQKPTVLQDRGGCSTFNKTPPYGNKTKGPNGEWKDTNA